MWTSVVLMGLGLGLVLTPAARRNEQILPWTCAMIFAGFWIDKGLGLVTGASCPRHWAMWTEYAPTPARMLISLGVYGVGVFILTIRYVLLSR
jgi:molybdopterin-containing oxidoreductase family membrane subunit